MLNPKNFDDNFCKYDYIGAPHTYGPTLEVGNGGFSFRTQKLLQVVRKLRSEIDISKENVPEDILISSQYRHMLELRGINFAPIELATLFSFQEDGLLLDTNQLFGFHGPMNFPRFFSDKYIATFAKDIIERLANFRILTWYLESCKKFNRHELFHESVDAINGLPSIIQVIESCIADAKEAWWVDRFVKAMTGRFEI